MPHATLKGNFKSTSVPLFPLFLLMLDWEHRPAEQTSTTTCHEMVTSASDSSR